VSSDDSFRTVMQQHQAVFDAIRDGKPPAASDAMAALILAAAERVRIRQAESSLATIQTHTFSEA
jgi:DNA-binding FadR family transcriptional regulator